jgi:uncharacterized protein with FMN-binding domain
MRRVALALFSTVAGLVILLGFKTHSPTSTIPAAVSTTGPTGSTDSSTGSSAAGASGASTPTSTSTSTSVSTGSKTVTGDSVDTRWGPVQVQVTVTNGKVTAAQAVVYPQENPRDQEINAYAIPTLNQEAVSSSSAQIDMVSGATVTSDGYISSLQSALDKAGL